MLPESVNVLRGARNLLRGVRNVLSELGKGREVFFVAPTLGERDRERVHLDLFEGVLVRLAIVPLAPEVFAGLHAVPSGLSFATISERGTQAIGDIGALSSIGNIRVGFRQ